MRYKNRERESCDVPSNTIRDLPTRQALVDENHTDATETVKGAGNNGFDGTRGTQRSVLHIVRVFLEDRSFVVGRGIMAVQEMVLEFHVFVVFFLSW